MKISEKIVVALAQYIAIRRSDLRAAGSFSGRELTLSTIDHPARGLGADRPGGAPSRSRPSPPKTGLGARLRRARRCAGRFRRAPSAGWHVVVRLRAPVSGRASACGWCGGPTRFPGTPEDGEWGPPSSERAGGVSRLCRCGLHGHSGRFPVARIGALILSRCSWLSLPAFSCGGGVFSSARRPRRRSARDSGRGRAQVLAHVRPGGVP